MKLEWKQLYGSMQQEIECCKMEQHDPTLRLEQCFLICNRYWGIIEKEMDGYRFSSVADEIEFYKYIKPCFVSEIRFYKLLYFLMNFEPEKAVEIKDFWLRELQRSDRFVRDNKDFCEYYQSGGTDRDEELFTKPLAEDENIKISQYDILAATFLSMEKYAGHIKKLMNL